MKRFFFVFFISAILLSGCKQDIFVQEAENDTPYYFIAVHNRPYHGERWADKKIKEDYSNLKEMISRANEYGLKLTLMLPSQWSSEVSDQDLKEWKASGHETAVFHRGVSSKNWDGYTDLAAKEVVAERKKLFSGREEKKGSLKDLIKRARRMNPGVMSGCWDGERVSDLFPGATFYDTCSGFANFGELGRPMDDKKTPLKGINEFIAAASVGKSNKKMLSHYMIDNLKSEKKAEETFYNMRKGVFGSATISSALGKEAFFSWLDFLYQRDREGKKSLTVSEVIKKGILSEKQLP